MGRDSAKMMMMMFLVLTSILLLLHLVTSSASFVNPNEKGGENRFSPYESDATTGTEAKPIENGGVCISKGGERFSPYQSDVCFSSNATHQVIVPCGGSTKDVKISKKASNGTIQTASDLEEEASLAPKTENFDIQKRIQEIGFVQKMSWVVATIVVGGIYFNRWRNHQERLDMVQMNARRLGSHMNGNA